MSRSRKQTLEEAMERIEKAKESRKGSRSVRERNVTLSHGSGGKATHDLIEGIFAPAFANPVLDLMGDAAVFAPNGTGERIAFTADSFVVTPLFFPGGDIGTLAVHGTVNDLTVSGATPSHLSVSVILEEGFPIETLRRIVDSMTEAAAAASVAIVTGDTKVVERGKADGLYVNTAGVGAMRPDAAVSPAGAEPGDRILVSGPLGDHGIAILMAREELAIESDIASDTAPLHELAGALFDALREDVHCLRDATRGGLAAALNEFAAASGVGIAIEEEAVPVRRDVRGACEILGIDPLQIANEGKLVAVVAEGRAREALEAMRAAPHGGEAAIVGEVLAEPAEMVFVRTAVGGKRVLDMLVGDALPRIC
ncbi:MAG: hydrogenase expression/formation protein HypE [Gemmatimonadota bacterium]|nr:hydrogenase expression/formation protein HypE [Gemmatimonadota bacterium]